MRWKCYLITLCSFLYFVMKVCLISPVLLSFLVHMASEVQIRQGSFKFTPRFPVERQKEVLLSFIRPSSISLFRDVSAGVWCQAETQHLKKPPFFLQDLAKLDCSWRIAFLFLNLYVCMYQVLYLTIPIQKFLVQSFPQLCPNTFFEIEREISLSTLDFSHEIETLVNACPSPPTS